jgi:hypothetical protein
MIMRVHLPHKIKKINEKSEQVFMLAKAPWATGFIRIGPHQLWALIPIKPHGQGLNPTPKYPKLKSQPLFSFNCGLTQDSFRSIMALQ